MPLEDLLRTLAETPDLPGAACMAHREVFDRCTAKAAKPSSYARAIQVCADCPALPKCRAWVRSLPPRKRPEGVTAGVIRPGR